MIEENQGLSGRLGSDEPTALAPPSGVKPASGLEQSRSSTDAVRRDTLGLTTDEIAWLQAAQGKRADADNAIGLYRMVCSCSQDPGARALFGCALADLRKSGAFSEQVQP